MRRWMIGALLLAGVATWLLWPDAEPDPNHGIRIAQGPEITEAYERLLASAPSSTPEPVVAEETVAPAPLRTSARGPVLPPNPNPVRILVLDDEGAPRAGVRARLELLPGHLESFPYWAAAAEATWSSFLTAGEDPVVAVSDEEGELQFDGIPLRRRYRIDIPAHGGYAPLSYFGTTVSARTETLTLAPLGQSLHVEVEGLPPHGGQAVLILRRDAGADLWGSVITKLRAACVIPLAPTGEAVTPPVPDGPLAADVLVPGVGVWRGIEVRRSDDGTARCRLEMPETMTLTGTLRGPHGERISGAGLTLAVKPFLKRRPARAWLRRAVSDQDGRFEFRGAPSGTVEELHVVADGYVTPRLMLEDVDLFPGERLHVPLQLLPAYTLEGTVTDALGRPVAGAIVKTLSRTMTRWDPSKVYTDGDGRFRIVGLAHGELSLTCTDPKTQAQAKRELELERPQTMLLPIALRRPEGGRNGKVMVTVVDIRGDPVAGAGITYRERRKNSTGTVQTGRTDASGTFQLTGLPTAVESLRVWAWKRGASSAAAGVNLERAEQGTETIRLMIPPTGVVKGQVVRGEHPVPSAIVSIRGTKRRAYTSPDGTFHLRGAPIGPQTVVVVSGGGTELGIPVRVEVREGETVEVTLELPEEEAGIQLRGRLVDGSGRPWVGVVVNTNSPDPRKRVPTAVTDEEGRFALPVATRDDYEVYSGRRRIATALSAGIEAQDVVFAPEEILYVQGRIFDQEGEPAYAWDLEVSSGHWGRQAESRTVGGFYRMSMPAYHPSLRISGRMYGTGRGGRAFRTDEAELPFEVRSTLDMRPTQPASEPAAAPGDDLRGFVVDEGGDPIQGVRIEVEASESGERAATTDARGMFRISELPPRPVQIHVFTDRPFPSTTREIRVSAAEGPVRITVPRIPASQLFTVRGTVVDATDRPLPDVLVNCRGDAGHWPHTRTDAAGRFEFPHMRRTELVVEVSRFQGRRGHGYGEASVDAGPGANDVVLRLPTRVRKPTERHDVPFRFVDPEGELLEGARPFVWLEGLGDLDGSDRRLPPFTKPEDGMLRMPDVPEGRYRVHVSFGGMDPLYLEVPPFEIAVPTAMVEVAVERTVELHGRVRADDAEGYVVTAQTKQGNTTTSMNKVVSASGAFVFRVPRTQSYVLTARRHDKEHYAVLTDVRAEGWPHELVPDQEGCTLEARYEAPEGKVESRTLQVRGPGIWLTLDWKAGEALTLRGLPPGPYQLVHSFFGMGSDEWEHVKEVRLDVEGAEVLFKRARAK